MTEYTLFCLPLGNPLIWIGATDEETEGQWVWDSTGSVIDFDNWVNDEPNNLNDHCACMNTAGGWWDVNCSWAGLNAICEVVY